MKVVEIFKSIDGEGKRTGLPVTFIRLFGCNLNCSYCDTRYGCEGNGYVEMTVDEIVNRVKSLNVPNITVTGGEPLIHKDIDILLGKLNVLNYDINIETNGSVDIKITKQFNHVWNTMDYKCPTSGMEDKMLLSNIRQLRTRDVLKFVVGSIEDLNKAKFILDLYPVKAQVYFSPIFNKIEPKDIVKYVLDNNMNTVKVQVQLHKVIWDPNKRGV